MTVSLELLFAESAALLSGSSENKEYDRALAEVCTSMSGTQMEFVDLTLLTLRKVKKAELSPTRAISIVKSYDHCPECDKWVSDLAMCPTCSQ